MTEIDLSPFGPLSPPWSQNLVAGNQSILLSRSCDFAAGRPPTSRPHIRTCNEMTGLAKERGGGRC